MSAGQSLRRGFAYGAHGMAQSGFDRRSGSPDMVTLIVIATIVLVIAAVVADPVLSGSIGHLFGTAWSELVRFLVRLVSRAG